MSSEHYKVSCYLEALNELKASQLYSVMLLSLKQERHHLVVESWIQRWIPTGSDGFSRVGSNLPAMPQTGFIFFFASVNAQKQFFHTTHARTARIKCTCKVYAHTQCIPEQIGSSRNPPLVESFVISAAESAAWTSHVLTMLLRWLSQITLFFGI